MGKVVELFGRKDLSKDKDKIPTPESEILAIMSDVRHAMKYHQIMGEYAKRILISLEIVDQHCTNSDSHVTWADIAPVLDSYENLIDISQSDHKAVIDAIFEGGFGYKKITDPILREIAKKYL